MRILSNLLIAAAMFMVLPGAAHAETGKQQYVLISFDGAHDNRLWNRSRELAKKHDARFTYFLSCVFLMTKADRRDYHPPRRKAGASNVGFAQNREEVSTRLDNIWQAHLEGHEIASHGCGHFDGANWSEADWNKEFSEFRRITTNAYKNNNIAGEPSGWKALVDEISGFRAPYLVTSKSLRHALINNGYRYDASAVTSGPIEPKSSDGIFSFGLPLIAEGPSNRPIIAMDYNLYVRHSKGKEVPEQSAQFEERTYKAFRASFDKQYEGERIPLQLGFHFVLMNNGAYWRAMERLVGEVCSKADVTCTSYQNYLAKTHGQTKATVQPRS